MNRGKSGQNIRILWIVGAPFGTRDSTEAIFCSGTGNGCTEGLPHSVLPLSLAISILNGLMRMRIATRHPSTGNCFWELQALQGQWFLLPGWLLLAVDQQYFPSVGVNNADLLISLNICKFRQCLWGNCMRKILQMQWLQSTFSNSCSQKTGSFSEDAVTIKQQGICSSEHTTALRSKFSDTQSSTWGHFQNRERELEQWCCCGWRVHNTYSAGNLSLVPRTYTRQHTVTLAPGEHKTSCSSLHWHLHSHAHTRARMHIYIHINTWKHTCTRMHAHF